MSKDLNKDTLTMKEQLTPKGGTLLNPFRIFYVPFLSENYSLYLEDSTSMRNDLIVSIQTR